MDYKDVNDYEVLYLIANNKEEGQKVLYNKYRPIITSLAYRYLSQAKNSGLEFDDLLQEGYIGLDSAICSYNDDSGVLFYTFALLCIKRQMHSVVRKHLSHKQEILNYALSLDQPLPSSNYMIQDIVADDRVVDPAMQLSFREREQQIIEFKHGLTWMQSCVFELRMNGFHYREISQLLDISKSSVDSYLGRIRNKLKKETFVVVI